MAPDDQLRLHLCKQLNAASGPLQLDVELQIRRGESLALLGPSGSGKTTLLRLLAGLVQADRGQIHAFGRCWLDSEQGLCLPPRQRRAGLVFQDYALFPNMTALGNVQFALPPGRPVARAMALLERVGLAGLAGQKPAFLSGGQQQRLALARALAAEPELLLLDEPLSALDGQLRRELQDELRDLHRQTGQTLIIVTHDPGDALRLAGRAVLLDHGRVVADAPPARLFGLSASERDPMVLTGRVVAEESHGETGNRYLVEAEGRLCPASTGPGIRLGIGDTVLLSSGEWQAHPLYNRTAP